MGWLMEPIYNTISWILRSWHWVWDLVIPGSGVFLGTTWPWILAIVFLVITVRIVLFPIFVKQIRSQRAMQALQPKMKQLQEKYKGDPQTLRQEMMKLYQEEKVNPLMGCLPMFLQIPVFIGLFHVLRYLNPIEHPESNKFYGWTVAQFDSAANSKLFGAPISMAFRSSSEHVLAVGGSVIAVKVVAAILIIAMMATTFLTSRQMILKTGWQQDPQQRMIQKLMLYGIPASLLLSGWYFPIGVIIYWVTQNLFSLGQQYWVLHKYPPPATVTAAARTTSGTRKSAVARFFAGEPIRVPAAAAGRTNGPIAPAQPVWSRLLRRKAEPAAPAAAAPARSLAPKPGAKPAQSRPGTPAQDEPGTSRSAEESPAGRGTGRDNGARAGRTPAAPGPGPDGSAAAGPGESGNGGAPGQKPKAPEPSAAGETQQPAGQRSGGQRAGAQRSGGQRSGGKRSGGQRKGASSRKSAGSRKGGPRR